jgi:hypothetical protein
VGRQRLIGGHRVSLTGKLLGNEKLGRTGQFGPQGVGLPLEAVGVLRSALYERSLATLFEFHNLELETDCVVFQTAIHHRLRAYPSPPVSNVRL